jgi:hypothetical protein
MDAATMKGRRIMQHKPHAIRLLLVILVLLLTTPAWAVPLTGFLEGTADNGWQGAFAVQLMDGTVMTGVDQMTLLGSVSSLPLTTVGCTVSPSCVAVNNLTTSTVFTMSGVILNLAGTATVESLGTVSWGAQPFWVLPGDPSPTAAVLADVNGTLGGTTLTSPPSAFAFNGTLTSTFISVAGGQALSSLRLDFTDGIPPPTSRTLLQGPVFIDNGVPVALGTPLTTAPVSVPEPSSVLLLSLSIAGLIGWQWKWKGIALS